MQTRRELVASYVNEGWVPFAYAAEFTPPRGWNRSIVTDTTVDDVSESPHPIGLLTGARSGVVVADIDPRNGGDPVRFMDYYGIGRKDTFVVSSATEGGYHMYFRHPDRDELPYLGDAGERLGVSALKGVDLSSADHHVVAPPSVRVGHPSKPDGSYEVRVNRPVAELPEPLLLDWLQAARPSGTALEGVPVEQAPESDHDWMVALHDRNVRYAAELPDGSRDNGVFSRICASVRIALALPDSRLSVEHVGEDYENGVPYEIKDIDGKLSRALEFAEQHEWKVLDRETSSIPNGIPERFAGDYEGDMDRMRYRDKLKELREVEKREEAARNVTLPDYQGADVFLSVPIQHPEWIVESLLHYNGSVLFSAEKKAGKTTMLLNLMRSLSSGCPLLGEYTVHQTMNTVWWDNELDDAMAHRWLSALPDLDRSKVTRVAGKGRTQSMDVRSQTLRQTHARRLREMGADVLIVDPIAPILSVLGLAESDSESIRPLLDGFDALAAEADLKAVIVTAHSGHSEKPRARGSSAFGDWTTSAWNLQLGTEGEFGSKRVFSVPFGRDSKEQPFKLDYNVDTRLFTRAEATPFTEPWEEWLEERQGQPLTTDEIIDGLGCSAPTARSRAKAAGWTETEPAGKGRGAKPAVWEYIVTDPFSNV